MTLEGDMSELQMVDTQASLDLSMSSGHGTASPGSTESPTSASSSSPARFVAPRRPGGGTIGRAISLRSNHLKVN